MLVTNKMYNDWGNIDNFKRTNALLCSNFQKCKLKQNILAIKERIDKIDKRDKSKQDDAKNILKVLKVL